MLDWFCVALQSQSNKNDAVCHKDSHVGQQNRRAEADTSTHGFNYLISYKDSETLGREEIASLTNEGLEREPSG